MARYGEIRDNRGSPSGVWLRRASSSWGELTRYGEIAARASLGVGEIWRDSRPITFAGVRSRVIEGFSRPSIRQVSACGVYPVPNCEGFERQGGHRSKPGWVATWGRRLAATHAEGERVSPRYSGGAYPPR